MTWQEAIENLPSPWHANARFRDHCHSADPKVADAHRRMALSLAGFPGGPEPAPIVPPPRPPASEVMDAMVLVRACPHRSRDAGCGCSGSRCALGKGRGGLVAHRDCLACVGLGLTD